MESAGSATRTRRDGGRQVRACLLDLGHRPQRFRRLQLSAARVHRLRRLGTTELADGLGRTSSGSMDHDGHGGVHVRAVHGDIGSPQAFRTGETFGNAPLIDYQHPHDLLMVVAVDGTRALNRASVSLGAALDSRPATPNDTRRRWRMDGVRATAAWPGWSRQARIARCTAISRRTCSRVCGACRARAPSTCAPRWWRKTSSMPVSIQSARDTPTVSRTSAHSRPDTCATFWLDASGGSVSGATSP